VPIIGGPIRLLRGLTHAHADVATVLPSPCCLCQNGRPPSV